MKRKYKITSLFLFLLYSSLTAQNAKEGDSNGAGTPSWQAAWDNIKQVGSAGLNLLSGFAEGFGGCPPERIYNMQVWSDVPAPTLAVVQNITKFIGAQLSGRPIATAKMNPFTNTGTGLNNLKAVCQGAVYLTPYAGKQGKELASYDNIVYDAQTSAMKIGGAGGTVVYIASDVLAILSDLAGVVTGANLIEDSALDTFSFYTRKFQTNPKLSPTYHYHGYNNKGKNKGEFLGAGLGGSNEFLGVFYNSSKQDAQLTFEKDGSKYTVTLESNSFNTLNSTDGVTNSIRPPATDDTKPFAQRRSFTFNLNNQSKSVSIPIPSEGVADSYTDAQGKAQTVPRSYTYEVYDGTNEQGVGIQGLQIGNYDQPGIRFQDSETAIIAAMPKDVTQRAQAIAGIMQNPPYSYQPDITKLRDINPVKCSIWLQAAADILKKLAEDTSYDYSMIPIDGPYPIWISYTTADSYVLEKITPGNTLDLNLLRPQIKEKTGYLFAFALDTNDENKAKQFFSRLFVTVRPKAYYSPITDPLAIPNVFSITPDTNGVVDDTKGTGASGVRGLYLLKDIFNQTGITNTATPYYYGLLPPYLQLSSIAGAIGAYIDTTKYPTPAELNKALADPISSWINYYEQNKQAIANMNITDVTSPNLEQVIPNLTSYLQTNGNKKTKENIKAALYTIIFGPTSISKPPIIWQTGTNYFNTPPTQWPKEDANQSG